MSRLDLPNLLLPGVGKAGTTSMFWYFSQHPDICAATVKETQYFLDLSEVDTEATGVLSPIEGYAKYFARCGQRRYRMEATPHYFHGGRRLVMGIVETLPDPKIVLTLRDPVDRAWSIYRFAKSRLHLPPSMSFQEFVDEGVKLNRDCELQSRSTRPFWSSIQGSMYSAFVPVWLDAFPRESIEIVYFEELQRDPMAMVARICRWLGIDDSCATAVRYTTENRSAAIRYRRLHRLALAMNGERILRNRRRLKGPLRRIYFTVNERRNQDVMPVAEGKRLQGLFEESNSELRDYLLRMGYHDMPPWLSGESDAHFG